MLIPMFCLISDFNSKFLKLTSLKSILELMRDFFFLHFSLNYLFYHTAMNGLVNLHSVFLKVWNWPFGSIRETFGYFAWIQDFPQRKKSIVLFVLLWQNSRIVEINPFPNKLIYKKRLSQVGNSWKLIYHLLILCFFLAVVSFLPHIFLGLLAVYDLKNNIIYCLKHTKGEFFVIDLIPEQKGIP